MLAHCAHVQGVVQALVGAGADASLGIGGYSIAHLLAHFGSAVLLKDAADAQQPAGWQHQLLTSSAPARRTPLQVVGTSAQQINLHADPAHTHNRAAAFTSPPFSCCIASPQTIPKPHLIPRPAHRHAWQLCKSRGFEGCAELLSAAQHGQQSATASIAAEEVCPAPGCRSPSSTISKPLTAVQRRHFEEAKAVHGGWQGAGVVRTRRCSPTWFSDTAAATSL
eukprot:4254657-Prymnesium_polylepis.1